MSTQEQGTRTRILAATWALMEKQRGSGVRMQDVAQAAGVSRQAVYLHFGSRTELLIATTHYGDELNGIDARLTKWEAATGGVDKLREFIEFWGNYIPCIYGIAQALLVQKATDEAAEAAWEDRMRAVRNGCRLTVEAIERDGKLPPAWSTETAIDVLWSLLSITTWQNLTVDCGWSIGEYVERMQTVASRTLVG